jgi:hypothetical protein
MAKASEGVAPVTVNLTDYHIEHKCKKGSIAWDDHATHPGLRGRTEDGAPCSAKWGRRPQLRIYVVSQCSTS